MKKSKAPKKGNHSPGHGQKATFKHYAKAEPERDVEEDGVQINSSDHFFFAPFRLNGSDFINRLPNIAERWAEAHDNNAVVLEEAGMEEYGNRERHLAAKWRELAALPETEAFELAQTMQSICSECIDALLVLTGKYDAFALFLTGLATQILDGFRESAAPGHDLVAKLWATTLSVNVGSFKILAEKKPELFREWSRGQFAIPGLISRNAWSKKKNDLLLELLQQGKESAAYCPPPDKRGRPFEYEGINSLAHELILHIEARRMLFQVRQIGAKHLSFPHWLREAVKLKKFSPDTWKEWKEVAWQLLKESTPGNAPAKHPAVRMMFNVREKRTNAYGDVVTAPSVGENDVKEALRDAFETIATGGSPRKKQRTKPQQDRRKNG